MGKAGSYSVVEAGVLPSGSAFSLAGLITRLVYQVKELVLK